MTGGTIIGLSRRPAATLLAVEGADGDECPVRVVEVRQDTGRPVRLAVGDRVWWKDGVVYWTPRGVRATGTRVVLGRCRYDIPLAVAKD